MIEPSELLHATRPFSDQAWLFEWKYDGFQCLVTKYGEHVDPLPTASETQPA